MRTHVTLLMLVAACGGADKTEFALEYADDVIDQGSGEQALLSTGSRGPEVEAASQYFMRYGYFSSEELRLQHPYWKPVVGEPPAEASVFGKELESAVAAFQARSGLPVTGAIDEETRKVMATPRCGVPDSAPREPWSESALVDKWAQNSSGWQPDTTITFSYNDDDLPASGMSGMTPQQVRDLLEVAFIHVWEKWTNLTFQEVSSADNPDVTIMIREPPVEGDLGTTLAFGDGMLLYLDIRDDWDDLVSEDGFDFLSVAIHELGHALGLDHSTVGCTTGNPPGPVMCSPLSRGEEGIAFQPDDLQAVAASPYTNWANAGGVKGSDIGASVVGAEEYVWRIADSAGGFAVSRWTGSTWSAPPGGGVGTRIDVAGRTPWVINSSGLAMQRAGVTAQSPAGTSWTNRGDCNFIDIGANAAGNVWAIGGAVDANGNHALYRYVNASGTQCAGWSVASTQLRGKFVDVGPDGSPWVLDVFGRIRKGNPTGSSSEVIPGVAKDIAVGPEASGPYGSVWMAATTLRVYTYNRQGSPVVRDAWYLLEDGQATFITVGRHGLPWVIAPGGIVSRRTSNP